MVKLVEIDYKWVKGDWSWYFLVEVGKSGQKLEEIGISFFGMTGGS